MSTNTLINRRPPVVTVMGHIDHGKTSLLDKIKLSHVQAGESGGITQHIGAYEVAIKVENQTHTITFIDTPGHAAFAQMRARGVSVTDLVVLVVAANDGVMAQTKECLDHIKQANVPFLVALNKIDVPGVNLDKAKGQLTELGYTPSDYGGQLTVIPVSAKTGEGIDKLLEAIWLHGQMLDLTSQPNAPLEAVVIESKLDPKSGPIATVVVRSGSLTRGARIFYGQDEQTIRQLTNWQKKPVQVVTPGQPTELLGLKTVPPVGAVLLAVPSVLETKSTQAVDPQTDGKKIKVVLKADTEGTLEALEKSLSSEVQRIASTVGSVTETDVFLAQAAGAQIYAFNSRVPVLVAKLAEHEGVKIFASSIIYEILDQLEKQVLKMLEPTIDEQVHGEAEIIAEFKIKKERIAGIRVLKGEIQKTNLIHLKRDEEIIKNTKVGSLRKGKEEVEKITVGQESGITFKPYIDFKLGDRIIAYN